MKSTKDMFTDKALNKQHFSNPKKSKQHPLLLYIVALTAGIGAFHVGYIGSVAPGALQNMKTDYDFTPFFPLLWSCMMLGITGSLFHGGILADNIGRKKVLMISSSLFLSGAVMLAAALNMHMVTVGLLLDSMGMGLTLIVSPIYIIECSSKEMRGRLGTLFEVMLQFGFSAGFLLNQLHVNNAWRFMFGFAAIPSLVQLISLHKLPDSPRYLVMKDQVLEASEALTALRVPGQNNLREINDIKSIVALDSGKTGFNCWMFVFTTYYVRKTVIICSLIGFFEQLSGISTVYMVYTAVLHNYGFSQGDVMWLFIIPTTFKLVSVFIGFKLIETIGRKKLLTYGFFACAVSNAVLGLGFFMGTMSTPITSPAFDLGSRGYCSELSHCFQCTQEPQCGYCAPKADILNSGSCVESCIDQHGFAYAKFGRCAKNSTHLDPMILMFNSCPQNSFNLFFLGAFLFFLCFEAAIGSVAPVMISEMFPLWARAFGCSIARMSGMIALVSSAAAFQAFGSVSDSHGWFFGFTVSNLIAAVYFRNVLPETMAKPLEWLQCLFMTEKDRRKFKNLLSEGRGTISLSARRTRDEEPKLQEPKTEYIPEPSILPEMLEFFERQSAKELKVDDSKRTSFASTPSQNK